MATKSKTKNITGTVSRKEKILQTAIKCFIKNGVAETSLRDIAQKAGVDQPLLNYYYPNLEALYFDVVQFVLNDLNSFMLSKVETADLDPKKVLKNYIHAYFEWVQENKGLGSLWMYFYYLSTVHKRFAQLNAQIQKSGLERISIILYQGMEKKVFHLNEGLSVAQLPKNIQIGITGHLIVAATGTGDVLGIEKTYKEFLSQVSFWVGVSFN